MAIAQDDSTAIVELIEENLYAFGLTQIGKWGRIDVFDEPHLLWFECDVPSPMFNVVHRARMSSGTANATITAVQERYARRNLPFVWWVDPSSTPQALSKYLVSAGFVQIGEMSGMAIDLQTFSEPPRPAEFEVLPTVDRSSVERFASTMCAGFEMKDSILEPMTELALAMGFGMEEPLFNYLGMYNGRPVSTSSLYITSGVAGIYNVSTIPEMRHLGFGTAVTTAPLLEAIRRGCRLAVLHSSSMAQQMYRRLGFNTYCYFHQYLWPATALSEVG